MKQTLHLFLLLIMFFVSAVTYAANGTLSGGGTVGSPYLIEDYADLEAITTYGLAKVYRQVNDIDASLSETENSGSGFVPLGNATTKFSGTYHGAGHVIRKLHISRASTPYVGLFGYFTGTVDSLGLLDATITGSTNVGGIAGHNLGGSVSYCYNTGSVSGTGYVGGVVGYAYTGSTVSHCYNTGAVTGIGSSYYVGGVIGRGTDCTVSNSYNTGIVTGVASTGGFIGYAYSNAIISTCYSTGAVVSTGTLVGGFVGFVYSSSFSTCYYDKITSTRNAAYGFADAIPSISTFTTAQMKKSSAVSGLDYTSIWAIRDDSIYPALQGLDNAPFAFRDTLSVSASALTTGVSASTLLQNDYDYETLQSALLLKIKTLSAGTTDSVSIINLPASVVNNQTITLTYRLAEARSITGDTLWGNLAQSVIEIKDKVPVAVSPLTTDEDTPFTALLATDPDNDPFSVAVIDSTLHGNVVLFHNDSITYTPDLNFNGTDSLRIELTDGLLTDTVWVKIIVASVNDAPVARDTTATTIAGMTVEITLTATDMDGTINSVDIVSFPIHGAATSSGTTITYMAPDDFSGKDTIIWAAMDDGGLASNPVYLIVTVLPQTLSVSSSTLNLAVLDGSTDSLKVTSNTTWDVSSSETWLTVNPTSKSGDGTLIFTATENPTTSERTATVIVSATGTPAQMVIVTQAGKIQLGITAPTLSVEKVYDANTTVAVVAGSLTNLDATDVGKLSVSATANYGDANVGAGKTITVEYSISGSVVGKYATPTDSVISTGVITPMQLTVTDPVLTTTKFYDTTPTAAVSAGTLTNVQSTDVANVSVSAIATYDNANVGTQKTITVVYSLSGSAVGNYLAPVNWIVSSGEIAPKQVTLTPAATVITNKMYDGNSTAAITSIGNLQGVEATDITNIGVSVTAHYDNASIGSGKIITVEYTLTGSAAANYAAPVEEVLSGAKISDIITLSEVHPVSAGCEGSDLTLSYSLTTGTPTQYEIIYGSAALSVGFKNVAYTDLPTAIELAIPQGTPYGTYQATLKMQNELGVESASYSFEFTVNISSDYILAKGNDIISFDNSSNHFTAYQWYKNGAVIDGATGQYYNDPAGWIGSYAVKVKTIDGQEFYTCPKELNIPFSSTQSAVLYPNPIKRAESCTVQMKGYTDAQLQGAVLSVYDIKGSLIHTSQNVAAVNQLAVFNQDGNYLVRVTLADGKKYLLKLIVKE